MNNSRRGAALTLSVVVALVLEGCSWIVLPEERQGWADRIAAAENNLKQERLDVEAAGNAARSNQLSFIDDIHSLRPNDNAADLDADDSRSQVLQWSKSQSEATDKIKDIEQDLALLRDEIEEDGF